MQYIMQYIARRKATGNLLIQAKDRPFFMRIKAHPHKSTAAYTDDGVMVKTKRVGVV